MEGSEDVRGRGNEEKTVQKVEKVPKMKKEEERRNNEDFIIIVSLTSKEDNRFPERSRVSSWSKCSTQPLTDLTQFPARFKSLNFS